MISINHLSITYNKSADILKNINLNIENGEIIALLGHNGSGKSTLIKCISGVLKPTQGCVTFDNINVFENRKKIIPDIGVVFNQKPSFIIDISVYDNLLFFKAIYELNNIHFAKNLELK